MGLARFLKLLAMPQRIDAEQLHRLLLYWRRKRKDEKNKNDPDFGTSVFSEYSVIPNSGMVNTAKNNKVTFPKSSSSIDNIVYSSETWKFSNPYTVTDSYSDHYMLYATGTYLKESS